MYLMQINARLSACLVIFLPCKSASDELGQTRHERWGAGVEYHFQEI